MRGWPSLPRACSRLAMSPEGPGRPGRCCYSAHRRTGSSTRRKFWSWSKVERALRARLPARIWPGLRERCRPFLVRISPSRKEIIAASSHSADKGYPVPWCTLCSERLGLCTVFLWLDRESGGPSQIRVNKTAAPACSRQAPQTTALGFSRKRPGRGGRAIGLTRTLLACGLRGCSSFARLRLAWEHLRLWAIGSGRKRLSFLRRYRGRYRLL